MSAKKKNRKAVKSEKSFVCSLDNLTPEDICSEEVLPDKRDALGILKKGIILFCAAVFCYSGCTVIYQLASKARANNAYDDIRNMFYDDSGIYYDGALAMSVGSAATPPITGNIYRDNGTQGIDEHFLVRSKLNALKTINQDIYGWIKIEGTSIDYPVVQGKDNDYYLNHTFDREYIRSGALFADYKNSKNLSLNYNTVIYGHNMTDGSMFHTLYNFGDRKFFENGLVKLTTQDGIYIYEVFSVHVAKETDPYFQTEFEDGQDFVAFASDMQEKSMFSKNIKFTQADRVLTLSTCTNRRKDERFVVHARQIDPNS